MLAEQRAAALVRQVVTLDDPHSQAQAPLPSERLNPRRRRPGIRGAEVADDRDAMLDAGLEDRPDEPVELRLVAGRGILPASDLGKREGALGQRLEEERRRTAS